MICSTSKIFFICILFGYFDSNDSYSCTTFSADSVYFKNWIEEGDTALSKGNSERAIYLYKKVINQTYTIDTMFDNIIGADYFFQKYRVCRILRDISFQNRRFSDAIHYQRMYVHYFGIVTYQNGGSVFIDEMGDSMFIFKCYVALGMKKEAMNTIGTFLLFWETCQKAFVEVANDLFGNDSLRSAFRYALYNHSIVEDKIVSYLFGSKIGLVSLEEEFPEKNPNEITQTELTIAFKKATRKLLDSNLYKLIME